MKKNSVSSPIKASFWFLVVSMLQRAINALTTPFFTRIMTEADYGLISVYTAWSSLLIVIVTLTIYNGVLNNGLIEFENKQNDFISSMAGLTILMVGGFYVIFLLFKTEITNIIGLSDMLMNIMFCEFIATAIYFYWLVAQRFYYKYKLVVILGIVNTVGGQLLAYLAVLMFPYEKATAKIIASLVPMFITGIAILIYISIKSRKFIHIAYWKYALVLAIPLVPHYLSGIILGQADRIMISKMVGNSEAGIYNIAYTVATVTSAMWFAINASFVPWVYRKLKQEDYKSIRRNSTFILVCLASACFLIILFAPEIIAILAPPTYSEAQYIIPSVAIGAFFMFTYLSFVNVEIYYKKTIWVTIATVIAAIFNIFANWLLIPKFGYMIAGYTTMASYSLMFILHFCVLKYFKKQKYFNIRILVITGLVLFGTGMLTMTIYNNLMIRILILTGIIIILAINSKKIISIFSELGKKK